MKHSQPFPRIGIYCLFIDLAANCRQASFPTMILSDLFGPWRLPAFYPKETLPASVFSRRGDYSPFTLMTLAGFCMETA